MADNSTPDLTAEKPDGATQDIDTVEQPSDGAPEAVTTTKLTPNQIAAWQALPENQKTAIRHREAIRIFNSGLEHHKNGDLAAAIEAYGKALVLDPGAADTYNNLGVALRSTGKLRAAIACYRRGLVLHPNHPNIYSNMGNAYRELGHLQLSVASHHKAIKLNSKNAEAYYNLGLALRDLGQIQQSLRAFETTLQLNPTHAECRCDRSLTLLSMGDFKRGLDEYEWRWKLDRNPPRKFDKPIWNGSELKGKTLLIHQEQDIGDMIQFARYIPMIKDRGGRVILETQPELSRLMSTAPGVDGVTVCGSELPEYDCYIPMMSLARLFATTLDTIPKPIPYLTPPEQPYIPLPASLDTQYKVGIAWAGNATHINDKNRSCDFSYFIELMGIPSINIYSLQKGENEADIKVNGCQALVVDMAPSLNDFADAAALIQNLDLVISVDTATAHLAGTLGKPVWLVLPFSADWRWLHETAQSPWYPSMRIFRQRQPGNWDQVFRDIRRALHEKLELT